MDKNTNEASVRKADSGSKMMTGCGPVMILTPPRSVTKSKPTGTTTPGNRKGK
jgi:hypothetical protein